MAPVQREAAIPQGQNHHMAEADHKAGVLYISTHLVYKSLLGYSSGYISKIRCLRRRRWSCKTNMGRHSKNCRMGVIVRDVAEATVRVPGEGDERNEE